MCAGDKQCIICEVSLGNHTYCLPWWHLSDLTTAGRVIKGVTSNSDLGNVIEGIKNYICTTPAKSTLFHQELSNASVDLKELYLSWPLGVFYQQMISSKSVISKPDPTLF